MKTVFFMLTGAGLLALGAQAYLQDNQGEADQRKLRNDPTYSTHNYKHPNKAAAARRWEGNAGVSVNQPTPTRNQLANYKRQVPGQQPAGGITVNHTPSADVADRNYKIQRPSPTTPASDVVRKRQEKSTKDKSVTDIAD